MHLIRVKGKNFKKVKENCYKFSSTDKNGNTNK